MLWHYSLRISLPDTDLTKHSRHERFPASPLACLLKDRLRKHLTAFLTCLHCTRTNIAEANILGQRGRTGASFIPANRVVWFCYLPRFFLLLILVFCFIPWLYLLFFVAFESLFLFLFYAFSPFLVFASFRGFSPWLFWWPLLLPSLAFSPFFILIFAWIFIASLVSFAASNYSLDFSCVIYVLVNNW